MRYDKIKEKINSLNKNKPPNSSYTITLTIGSTTTGVTVNGNAPAPLIITKDTGPILISVPAAGATLNLMLTY